MLLTDSIVKLQTCLQDFNCGFDAVSTVKVCVISVLFPQPYPPTTVLVNPPSNSISPPQNEHSAAMTSHHASKAQLKSSASRPLR